MYSSPGRHPIVVVCCLVFIILAVNPVAAALIRPETTVPQYGSVPGIMFAYIPAHSASPVASASFVRYAGITLPMANSSDALLIHPAGSAVRVSPLILPDASSSAGRCQDVQPILPSRTESSLEGTTWHLISYGFTGAPQKVLEGTDITLFFDRLTRKVTGISGCNLIFASYTAGKTTLTISGLGSTKMYCSLPEGVMSQEQRVADILSRASGYSISGTSLTITTYSGQALLFSA